MSRITWLLPNGEHLVGGLRPDNLDMTNTDQDIIQTFLLDHT